MFPEINNFLKLKIFSNVNMPVNSFSCITFKSYGVKIFCLSGHNKRAPIEQWKWKGLCENKGICLALEQRLCWRSNLLILQLNIFATSLLASLAGDKRWLVNFVRLLKTVTELWTGCFMMMKSCHICNDWLKEVFSK